MGRRVTSIIVFAKRTLVPVGDLPGWLAFSHAVVARKPASGVDYPTPYYVTLGAVQLDLADASRN